MAKYIIEKIKILSHFHIEPTEEELEHLWQLKSLMAIDNYTKNLIRKYWGLL